ncbi:phosphoglucosamine mutase [Limnochorda pilosa]|uniref:Phosphoglucosamine mutase n=1 Tax=Limnochorda pilosa TaxID=1555112 RepID=A0A0K2SJA6_LIMPI|nr:phosphoglucosamine mutase [Limnochorda pilosa]BAS27117.1 phosphoglucosamine mutase [Limnochorda pilosa]
MGRLFGTDGVRGVANRELTPELAFRLGRAAAQVVAHRGSGRPRVGIGRDTRSSGEMLQAALAAGLASAGCDVELLGVVPTPGVAALTGLLGLQAGAVISASHNPAEDNGIKFFGPDGYKLPDDDEAAIEALCEAGEDRGPRPVGARVGRIEHREDANERYIDFLLRKVPVDLSGMRLVVDCANGAAYRTAPEVLRRLGAEVIALNVEPDGSNINVECGSTHPEVIQQAVVEHGAHAGFAHDGDADRLIAADALGRLLDGDRTLAICAIHLAERGRLRGGAVAATRYSNLGLAHTLERYGVRVIATDAGDRQVLAAMLEHGLVLGGEQSGHVIFLEETTTGDGILTALKLLQVVRERETPLAELRDWMHEVPQHLENVRVAHKERLEESEACRAVIAEAAERLGERGRIFVRASGTEPVIRVLLEGEDPTLLHELADRVGGAIRRELGEA